MWRTLRAGWAGAVLLLAVGCMTGPMMDNPMLYVQGPTQGNPVFVPLGPDQYGKVFENVLKALADFGFEVPDQGANRYSGKVLTLPRISPGIILFPKPGSPSVYERVLATMQTYRDRVQVDIDPAEPPMGGFFIQVIVYKELEDLPRPVRATAGAAIFRNDNNVERQFEVIDPTYYESGWIPKGRDTAMEQSILCRLKSWM